MPLLLAAAVFAAACNHEAPLELAARQAGNAVPAAAAATPAVKPLRLRPASGEAYFVGTAVDLEGDTLPPGERLEIVWETVSGGWVTEDYFRFLGKRYTEATRVLGEASVGPDGRLAYQFAVPEDFGGVHNVLARSADRIVAQGGVEVSPSFEMSPAEGPVGTVIEVRARGLGWRQMDSTYVLNWDNSEAGWISAASSGGSAVARFRASGTPGDHMVKLYSGYTGHAYLNYEQAPTAHLPRPLFVFRVTPGGAPKPAYAEPYAPQPGLPDAGADSGPRAALSPAQGPVRTSARLTITGLPANARVTLVWDTQAGSRVTEAGFGGRQLDLGEATADASGRLDLPVTIPDDLGGLHKLFIRSGGETLATTHFTIETSIVSFSPVSGPAGTPVSIHLKGVGWTDYDNIYVATYDNAVMGYACGFNSQGDVVINFTAAGAPGVHLIDLYPGIYQGPENGQPVYRLPQLTYADDHPGNRIPALRFAFTVTPSAPSPRRTQ